MVRAVVQIVRNLQCLRGRIQRRQGDQLTIAVHLPDHVTDHVGFANRVLLTDARGPEPLHKRQAAPVEPGQLIPGQLNLHIVDAEPRASAHAVLDGLDLDRSVAQRCAPGSLGHVLHASGDAGHPGTT